MLRNLRILYSVVALAAFSLAAQAQASLKMRTFSMADGLPSNTVTMLTTGSNGMLWIGTWNGLCNYDGYRFNSFAASMGAGQMLTTNRMRFVTPDDDGNVWITTADNRLFLLDGKERRYVDYQDKLTELGLENFEVRFMQSLSNGAVWIFGMNGKNLRVQDGKHEVVATNPAKTELCNNVLLLADGSEWLVGERTVCKYGELETVSLPPAVSRITAAQVMKAGRIAIATDAGLFIYDGKTVAMISDSSFHNLYCDAKDRLWSTRRDGTAVMIETETKTKTKTETETKTLDCTVPADWPRITFEEALVHEDMYGTVWLLLEGKTLCRYDEAAGKLVPIDLRKAGGNVPGEMKLDRVFSDRHRNLWFSSFFNLYELSFCNYKFRETPIATSEESRSMLADSKGRIWVGTRQGHIAILSSDCTKQGYLVANGTVSRTPAKFCNNGIYSIYEDKKHRIWIGTRGNGLYLLTPTGEKFAVEHFLKSGGEICGDDYYDILEDVTGRIWFATYITGLMYLDESWGDRRFVSALNCKALSLSNGNIRKIRRICNAKDGTLMFSTADGILTINPHFNRPEEIKINVTSYAPCEQNTLLARDVMQILPCLKSSVVYVATMGGGVQTITSGNLQQNSLQFRDVAVSFPDIGTVRGMVEDSHGRVWIVGENAIHMLSADGKEVYTYNRNDWGKDLEFCEAKPVIDPATGTVIVATAGGIVTFRPDEMKQSGFQPQIVFTGIQYQGAESVLPLIGNNEITLPTDRHNAVVYFSALDYRDNSQIRYAYRVRELDKQWSFVGKEHCASLSNLPSGHYTLEVRFTNNEGAWLDNQAELRIYVEPTFWQTPWAWLLYLVIGGMMLYFAVYLIWLRKAHRMEKKMKERQLRFFTDISHQLRTPLTLIGGPVTEVLNTEQLSEKANNLLKAVENNASKMLALVNKTLDLKKLQLLNEEVENPSPEGESSLALSPVAPSQVFEDLTILIVEDNDELRYFLKTSLASRYNIIEAENGKIGLRMAAEHQPDFIITDIMMPEMDGITMLRRIKSDETICHIPIVILSARTADVYRIEGLREGADDYITKPFSISYLQVRVESIIHQRRMLQEEWQRRLLPTKEEEPSGKPASEPANEPSEEQGSELTAIDQKFAESMTLYINDNLHNTELKIEDIASAMCMSRTVFYGKVKAIYGISPVDVLRDLRMSHACTILREDFTKNVADVAYAVGYSDPRYFARCFKQSIGKTPTEYRKGS